MQIWFVITLLHVFLPGHFLRLSGQNILGVVFLPLSRHVAVGWFLICCHSQPVKGHISLFLTFPPGEPPIHK